MKKRKIKNIAIIAHVDHGKTTLVDAMLRQTGTFRDNQQVAERIMDSNDIERERGITIFSKNASLSYGGYKINIVDTPGHADFGGEVQRIMKMVDSVLLLVDAYEGPMPQTKYVLKKSLELGLKPVVVINKIDRQNARPHVVLDQIFDLFLELSADDSQLDFPAVYASSRDGFAKYEVEDESDNLVPLFETIIKNVADTEGDPSSPLQMLISAIDYDNYVGKIATGKIHKGKITRNDTVSLVDSAGIIENFKITKVYLYDGLNRIEVNEALAGDIVSLAGTDNFDVGKTVASTENPLALPSIEIDPPTLAIEFMVNDSPLAGLDGDYLTSRHIWDRLEKEIQTNVSIQIEKTDSPDSFTVKGRGELQLAILIENMRREGYELQLSKPRVLFREIDGLLSEPVEHLIVDVDKDYTGPVMEKISQRKGELINMIAGTDGYTRLEFHIPARGLLGYRNEFITDTRGTGLMNHSFYGYAPCKSDIPTRNKGALISMCDGESTAYAIFNMQARGVFFVGPGAKVYTGMIVGANNRDTDLELNLCRTKKLTNIRAAGSDEAIRLTPPRELTIEQGLEYINDDELMEVTPHNIRFRKKILDANQRKASRSLKKK